MKNYVDKFVQKYLTKKKYKLTVGFFYRYTNFKLF